jgi:hypothetical protein
MMVCFTCLSTISPLHITFSTLSCHIMGQIVCGCANLQASEYVSWCVTEAAHGMMGKCTSFGARGEYVESAIVRASTSALVRI